jgi:hypothetical protein
MRLLKIMMPVVLAAGALFGQDKPPAAAEATPTPSYDAVIIPVKTLTGDSFERLIRLLGVFQARMQADDKLRTIVVYAPKDVVDKVRKVVEQLDQPGSEAAIGRNIDMTLTFLRASTKVPAQPSSLPADMESGARQIGAGPLWDTVPMRLQEGKDTQESLRMPSGLFNAPGWNSTGQISMRPEGVTHKDAGRSVRISNLRINFRIPYQTTPGQFQYMEVGLTTSGDFIEGQKTVLGKVSSLDDESSIFVVISLKVLD